MASPITSKLRSTAERSMWVIAVLFDGARSRPFRNALRRLADILKQLGGLTLHRAASACG